MRKQLTSPKCLSIQAQRHQAIHAKAVSSIEEQTDTIKYLERNNRMFHPLSKITIKESTLRTIRDNLQKRLWLI